MVWRLLLLFFITSNALILPGQPVIDDFEQANIDAWQVIEGNAEISDIYAYADNYSVRVYKSSSSDSLPAAIKHRTFQESYGKYRMKCYVLGADAEARVRFHYENENQYYEVISRPLGTDLPGLFLCRVINGERETLSQVPSLIHLDTWYQITIHRTCAGEILVYVNDLLRISIFDAELRQPGSVGLGARGGSTYYDDVTFERIQGTVVIDIDTTICTGNVLRIGSNVYTEAGDYQDTIPVGLDCDSILWVSLTYREHFEVFLSDTVCSNEEYVFGEDTLRQSGNYQQTLTSITGCDSVIHLTLWVLNGDTVEIDHTICRGDSYFFDDRQINSPGSYYDTLQSESGCFAIRKLNLEVFDELEFLPGDTATCFFIDQYYTIGHPQYDQIRWSDGSTGPALIVAQPGTYWGEVQFGSCTWRDSITFYLACDSTIEAFIPNVFTPNFDGINDFFTPQFKVLPLNFALRIFDRQGRLVFTSHDPARGWDGSVDGRHLGEGTYVYWLQADHQQFSGSITLIR